MCEREVRHSAFQISNLPQPTKIASCVKAGHFRALRAPTTTQRKLSHNLTSMLALKKKREAEAKAKAAAEASGAASTQPSSAPSSGGESTSSDNKVSLLGIGGKKKSKENGSGGKKRTPGEIRIQKGEFDALGAELYQLF